MLFFIHMIGKQYKGFDYQVNSDLALLVGYHNLTNIKGHGNN